MRSVCALRCCVAALVAALLLWGGGVSGVSAESDLSMGAEGDVLAAIPPDILPKMRELARLLQRSIAQGQLSDSQIKQDLQTGQLAEVVRGLSPEAKILLEDITRELQGRYREEELSGLLESLSPHIP